MTCDVGINHLRFTEQDVIGFDTRFKIEPPFRSEADRKALISGLNDGTIDAIVSGHQPQDRESKYLEFDLADPGVISLQTIFPILYIGSVIVRIKKLLYLSAFGSYKCRIIASYMIKMIKFLILFCVANSPVHS